MFRPLLVIKGSIFGSTLLVIFLIYATAGMNTSNTYAKTNNSPPYYIAPATLQASSPVSADRHMDDDQSCRISSKFPQKINRWCKTITHYADKYGLDPNLVAALIWQESGGNPLAYSKSGAVGLMQVMPRDGIAASFMCVNGPCFSNRPSIEELQNPEFNVSYGTKMLAGLLVKKGNMRDALKAYGPINVGYYYADKVLGIYERYRD